jgi:hypothetical protein
MKTQILVLAAGEAKGDAESQPYPVYLAEVDGLTVLEHIFARTSIIPKSSHIFVFTANDIKRYRLGNIVKNICEDSKVSSIPEATAGSACTALFVASQLDQTAPLLIISANELVEVDLKTVVEEFLGKSVAAGTIVFKSNHPRYSFVRLDEAGRVVEAAQRNPISNLATAGVFYFRATNFFVRNCKSMILKNACTDGNFYIAPVFNEIILEGGEVGVYEIDKFCYKPLKTERHIALHSIGTR